MAILRADDTLGALPRAEAAMDDEKKNDSAPRISGEFRNGSLTAISVIVGFSLSFLSRWAGTPGKWHIADLFAVALIVAGGVAVALVAEITGLEQGILGG